MKSWLMVYRIAWGVLLALLVILVFNMFLPSVRENKAKLRKIDTLEQENKLSEEAIRDIKRNKSRFENDPEFVERLAREELGKAKEGETVFRFNKPEEPVNRVGNR